MSNVIIENSFEIIKKSSIYQDLMAVGIFREVTPYSHFGARLYLPCYDVMKEHTYSFLIVTTPYFDGPEVTIQIHSRGWDRHDFVRGYIATSISFEEVFEDVPPEVQEKMLWHLDILK